MSQCQLLHNPQCSKSRAAFEWLVEEGIDFEVIDYLNTPLTVGQIRAICHKLGLKPAQIVRSKELRANKDLYFQDKKALDDDKWFDLLHRHPHLIERPICIVGDKAAIGRPLGNIQAMIADSDVEDA